MPEEHATLDTPPDLVALCGAKMTVYFVALDGGAIVNGVRSEHDEDVPLTEEQRAKVETMVAASVRDTYLDARHAGGKVRDAARDVRTYRTKPVHYRRGRHV